MPIANALTARICLCQKFKVFLNSCIPFCCNSCHFAAVYALKPPYYIYNTCADSKGGGGGSFPSPSPLYESLLACCTPTLEEFMACLGSFWCGPFNFPSSCVLPLPPPVTRGWELRGCNHHLSLASLVGSPLCVLY